MRLTDKLWSPGERFRGRCRRCILVFVFTTTHDNASSIVFRSSLRLRLAGGGEEDGVAIPLPAARCVFECGEPEERFRPRPETRLEAVFLVFSRFESE